MFELWIHFGDGKYLSLVKNPLEFERIVRSGGKCDKFESHGMSVDRAIYKENYKYEKNLF